MKLYLGIDVTSHNSTYYNHFFPFTVTTFQLEFLSRNECNKPESRDEGVELAVGNWEKDGYWIPLRYYYPNTIHQKKIKIGEFSCCSDEESLSLRGFDVPAKRVNETKNVSLEICNQEYLKHGYIQFRWLQTSTNNASKDPPVDVWALDNVTIIGSNLPGKKKSVARHTHQSI